MSAASIGVDQPQIDVPCVQSALHVGYVLPVRRPDRYPHRHLRIVFEGDLAILLGFQIQYPEIAMSPAVAQIYEFMISGGSGRCLHDPGLVRDLDAAANVFFRVAVDRVAPNIELDLPARRDDVAALIQIRRDIRGLPESKLTQIPSSRLDRPQIHGSQVENSVASRRAVDHSGAVGKPCKTFERIPIPRDCLGAAPFGRHIKDVVIKGSAPLESQLLVVRRPAQAGVGVFVRKNRESLRVRPVRICHGQFEFPLIGMEIGDVFAVMAQVSAAQAADQRTSGSSQRGDLPDFPFPVRLLGWREINQR